MTPVTVIEHAGAQSQIIGPDGTRTWLTCGANFVIAVSAVQAGSVLERLGNPDESMLFLPDVAAQIFAGDEQVMMEPDSVAILPPGDSRVVAEGDGTIISVFSSRATDLYAQGVNAAQYADGAPGVAPLQDGPVPPGGFRLRVYRLADYGSPGSNMRIFRSTNLMINPTMRRSAPRDVTALTPHSHEDFEQASLVVAGNYIHHARYPWTANLNEWRADENLPAGTPSVTIIPPRVIHTSRNIDAPGYLIDIFAPPRMDFERRGMVCNAADYPLSIEESITA